MMAPLSGTFFFLLLSKVSAFVTPKPALSSPNRYGTSDAEPIKVPESSHSYTARTGDVSLNSMADSGIGPLIPTAAAAGLFLYYLSQKEFEVNEVETETDASSDKGVVNVNDSVDKKDEKVEETETAKDTTSEVEVVPDKESEVESTGEAVVEDVVDEVVDEIVDDVEETNDEIEESPIEIVEVVETEISEITTTEPESDSTSSSTPLPSPDVDAAKKRVTSTLASELAMRDRFEKTKADDATKEEVPVPEPSNTPKKFSRPKGKSSLFTDDSNIKAKSPFVVRVLKKIVKPWRKFSSIE